MTPANLVPTCVVRGFNSKASLCLFVFFVTLTVTEMSMPGGLGEIKDADASVQEIVDKVFSAVNEKTGSNFTKLTALKYGTQVVAGTNYFVKVKSDTGKILHLRIYQALPYTNAGPELSSLQTDKTEADPLTYFD